MTEEQKQAYREMDRAILAATNPIAFGPPRMSLAIFLSVGIAIALAALTLGLMIGRLTND